MNNMNAINTYSGRGSSTYYSKSNRMSQGTKGVDDKVRPGSNSYDIDKGLQELYNKTKNDNRVNKPKSGMIVSTYTDKEGNVHRTYSGQGTDVVESMKDYKVDVGKDKVKIKKRLNYSYQKVSNQVIMAKTSMSASKAVLSARRSLSELKMKLKTAECSDDEKQAALAHATNMLRIATKKKKHLEQEEMIKNTMNADERRKLANKGGGNINIEKIIDSKEEPEEDPNNASNDAFNELTEDTGLSDEPVSEAYDAGEEMLARSLAMAAEEESLAADDASEDEMDEAVTEEMMELMSDMSEEMAAELEELEELMDMMDEMVNPHMDKEEFEKFKTKNRCEEQKEQVKADTEYLKVLLSAMDGASSVSGTSISGTLISGTPIDAGAAEMSLGFSVQA